MIKLKSLPISPEQQLKKLNWDWMLGKDTLSYIKDEVVLVREEEAENYMEAVNTLYDMYIEAAQYVIDNNLFLDLGIPENIIPMIRHTWEDERYLHIYGRFDLSGGLNGKPIKLIEFNADTATCIPETAVVQWAHLLSNGQDESKQFNGLYESLKENFKKLRSLNEDKAPTLLISTMHEFPEDETNVSVLGEAASEAGFLVKYSYIKDVEFSADEGVFLERDNGDFQQFNFWFKLVPWEYIAYDEAELCDILTQLTLTNKVIILNPAYTLLFQSKGLLKVLWEQYPYHPLLLETSDKPLLHKEYCVEKVMFGREGANVRIISNRGDVVAEADGEYGAYRKIYQEYTEFLQDAHGQHYQAGVFIASEACALGYRCGSEILDNTARFAGHIVD
jgi:glutathionylspermidine synthase